MAENRRAWGIDIGQSGLKAICLGYAEGADQLMALEFDYIAHPKMLSQPDAIPEELIPQALEKFLSRNDVQGDVVAISVPGQTALSRFIQLPPVEASKIAEIVKYEARQQIPFALEDVIWDYQALGGGSEEGGFMLEAEVGLFAMKRDQVMQHLRPFSDAKVEVELIQIAPLALYNFLTYDQFGITPDDGAVGMDEYTIVLDMGADNTTLVVSNGEKIWIRNVPIGGSHFTRALTKEMKLTFAKAEHLKRNATKSPDPRAVFQALRPVFNDYVSEIQRSIGYFSSVNRNATISKVLGLGNGFKLAGLQKFLQQNLQYEVEPIDSFQTLSGDNVLHDPLFEENILTFAVPYGLALQALKQTQIRTTLLPPEIATARTIRRKKPLAAAAAAVFLLGLTISQGAFSYSYKKVSPERFGDAETQMDELQKKIGGWKSAYAGVTGENATIAKQGDQLVSSLAAREQWLELFKAINACLPRDEGEQSDTENIALQNRIKLPAITAERVGDFEEWFSTIPSSRKDGMHLDDREKAPTGPGYVFKLRGVHYHDDRTSLTGSGGRYVTATLLENLHQWTVPQEDGPPVPVRKMGITHAVIMLSPKPFEFELDLVPGIKETPRGNEYLIPELFGENRRIPGLARGNRNQLNQPKGINPGALNADEYDERVSSDSVSSYDGPRRARANRRRSLEQDNDLTVDNFIRRNRQRRIANEKDSDWLKLKQSDFLLHFIWKPVPVQDRQEEPPKSATPPQQP